MYIVDLDLIISRSRSPDPSSLGDSENRVRPPVGKLVEIYILKPVSL